MQVQEIMNTDVQLADPNMTIRDIARRMRAENVGALPVGENDRLIGMVTDRDIVVRAVAEERSPGNTTVRDGPRLRSIAQAVEFAKQMVDQRSFDLWKDTLRRLEAVSTAEEAVEAAGALRELLQTEDMLLPGKGRLHTRARVNDCPSSGRSRCGAIPIAWSVPRRRQR